MNAKLGGMFGVGAAALGLALSLAPARAGDDGQASLVSGLAHTFGITKEDDTQIDYRERSKLVLPPKMTLPPPGQAAGAHGDASAWPTNVETVREKKRRKMEDAEPSARERADPSYRLIKPGDAVTVSTSTFDSHGPSCRNPDPKTGECGSKPASSWDTWNPMVWVGVQKKAPVVMAPEPDRENLTDPPKGLRAPAEGVGAKVDNN